MDKMNWRDIQVCLAVANKGTISEAAKDLNVSASTVYRRIDAFEASLGTALFERHARGYTLTDHGKQMLASAVPMQEAALLFEHQLEDAKVEPSGTLTINAPEGFGIVFCQYIRPFLSLYPQLRLRLVFDQHLINLAAGEADLVIRVTNKPKEQLWGRRLGSLEFQVFGTRQYAEEIDGDVEKARWVVMDRSHRDTPIGMWEHKAIDPDAIAMETSSRIMQSHAILNHVGVGALPTLMARSFSDQLIPIGTPLRLPILDMWILAHETRRHSHKIKALMHFVAEQSQVAFPSCSRLDVFWVGKRSFIGLVGLNVSRYFLLVSRKLYLFSPRTMSKKIHTLLTSLNQSITDYSIGMTPYASVLSKLNVHKNTIQKHFVSWAAPPESLLDDLDHYRAAPILVAAVALLTRRASKSFADEFVPYLVLAPMTMHYVPVEDTAEMFNGLPQEQLIHVIETAFARDDSNLEGAMCLIPSVEDNDVFTRLVQQALELSDAKTIALCLKPVAARAFGVARDVQRAGDDSPFMTNVALRLGNHCATIPDDAFYLEALANKSKTFREFAQLGISSHGVDARSLLEVGSKARKKVVREWCVAQLSIIGDMVEEETTSGQNAFELLGKDEQQEMLRYIEKLDDLKPATWTKWIKQKVSLDPMAWMFATLELFTQNNAYTHLWRVLTTLLTSDETASHHESLWSVYLSHLARDPTIKSANTQWNLKSHFKLIPRDFEQQVLDLALLGASAPMTVPMLEHYFAVRLCSPAVLSMALTHKSKKVRDAAVSGSVFWSSEDDAGGIVALLKARKKDTRLYASKALVMMPVEHLLPHRDVFDALIEKEKYDEVRNALEAVVAKVE